MSIGTVSPFLPTGTVSVSVGSASGNVALAGGGDTVVVTNTSSNLVYVRFGAGPSVTATTSDMPVLPSSQAILAVNFLITYAAAISPTGTSAVLFSRGNGSIV
jgi:hypothetical protein